MLGAPGTCIRYASHSLWDVDGWLGNKINMLPLVTRALCLPVLLCILPHAGRPALCMWVVLLLSGAVLEAFLLLPVVLSQTRPTVLLRMAHRVG